MNGYKTLSVGKIYHKIADDPQGWSEKPRILQSNIPAGILTLIRIHLRFRKNTKRLKRKNRKEERLLPDLHMKCQMSAITHIAMAKMPITPLKN